MFTLIKREIRDNLLYFMAVIIVEIMLLIMLFTSFLYGGANRGQDSFLRIIFIINPLFLVFSTFIFAALAASQMYFDKQRRVSAMLATLAVSRKQIYLSRIIAGLISVLILFVPLVVTSVILLPLKAPAYSDFIASYNQIVWTVFLFCLGGYGLGLITGWTDNKLRPTLAAFLILSIMLTLVLVKGFGWPVSGILIVFIGCAVWYAWSQYKTASL